jgi:nicotinamidase-related amidase
VKRPRRLIDPADCALLLIDLQIDSVGATSTRDRSRLGEGVRGLVRLGELYGLPAIVTAGRKTGAGAALIPELHSVTAGVLPRTTLDALNEPTVAQAIEDAGRETLILAGVALDIGVATAALSAIEAGYRVYVVAEACATTDALAESTAISRLVQAGATWIGFAALALTMMDDFASSTSAEVRRLVQAIDPAHLQAHV